MASIGTEGRILREENERVAEVATMRWSSICFALVKFSSIYPDNTMRRAFAFVAELALSVHPVDLYDIVLGNHR